MITTASPIELAWTLEHAIGILVSGRLLTAVIEKNRASQGESQRSDDFDPLTEEGVGIVGARNLRDESFKLAIHIGCLLLGIWQMTVPDTAGKAFGDYAAAWMLIAIIGLLPISSMYNIHDNRRMEALLVRVRARLRQNQEEHADAQ